MAMVIWPMSMAICHGIISGRTQTQDPGRDRTRQDGRAALLRPKSCVAALSIEFSQAAHAAVVMAIVMIMATALVMAMVISRAMAMPKAMAPMIRLEGVALRAPPFFS